MGLSDISTRFSAAQAITATAFSTSHIPLSVFRDPAPGTPLFVRFVVNSDFTAAGAATLQLGIWLARTNTGVPDAFDTLLLETAPITKESLVTGMTWYVPLRELTSAESFLSKAVTAHSNPGGLSLVVNYLVATGPFLTGTISADIVLAPTAHYQDTTAGVISPQIPVYSGGYSIT